METIIEKTPLKTSLIGTIRRFGKDGVLYEVLHEIDDKSVMIHVFDTEEETPYPIVDAQYDPTE